MTSAKEIFSKEFSKLISHILEILLLFIQPRRFFAIISKESNTELIRRIIIYIILFELLGISLFTFISTGKEFTFLSLFGLAVLELILSLYLLPVFILVGKMCNPKVSVRVTVTYLIMIKLIFGTILLVLTSFFLLSENYIVAIIRGISVYIFLLVIVIAYSFIFSTNLKSRILTLFASVILSGVYVYAMGYVLTLTLIDKVNYNFFMSLSDSIGKETDEFIEGMERYDLLYDNTFYDKFISEGELIITNKKLNVKIEEIKKFEKQYMSEFRSKMNFVDSLYKGYKYQTTKSFAEQKKSEIISAISYLKSFIEFSNINQDENVSEQITILLKENQNCLIELLKKRIDLISNINQLNELRFMLYKYRLLVPS